MSRKSRQRRGRRILSGLLPVWVLLPMLILCLGMGGLGVIRPWLTQPTPYEDTIPLSATLTEVEGDYHYRRNHRSLRNIYLYFEDHDRLMFGHVLASESLLDKLEAFPAGTVFDMRVEPNGKDVMALSVDGEDVLAYEAACRAYEANNAFGFGLGIFSLAAAAYAAWSLYMTWKYRRLA